MKTRAHFPAPDGIIVEFTITATVSEWRAVAAAIRERARWPAAEMGDQVRAVLATLLAQIDAVDGHGLSHRCSR